MILKPYPKFNHETLPCIAVHNTPAVGISGNNNTWVSLCNGALDGITLSTFIVFIVVMNLFMWIVSPTISDFMYRLAFKMEWMSMALTVGG